MELNVGAELYLNGMITGLNWVISLIFLKYWRETRDRLFLIFATSFLVLGLSRMRSVIPVAADWVIGSQVLRLIAFGMILAAIVDKNLPGRVGDESPSDSQPPSTT